MKVLIYLITSLIISIPSFADAKLKVSKAFGSGMILQQKQPIKVWGEASPNETVLVKLGSEEQEAVTSEEGRWSVSFAAREASFEPVILKVNDLIFDNILIGEVWLCSGQSNMEFRIRQIDGTEALELNNKNLRLCLHGTLPNIVKQGYTEEQLKRCNTKDFFQPKWLESTKDNSQEFSGAAWVFGDELQRKLGVPVGLIQIAMGGSTMDNWLPEDVAREYPLTKDLFVGDWLKNSLVPPGHRSRGKSAMKHVWKKGEPYYIKSSNPYRWMCEPSFLFDAGIEPLQGLKIAGVIWYQGEADSNNKTRVKNAPTLFPFLIKTWREHFDQPNFPFLFVQLPGYKKGTWPVFREIQRQVAKSVDNTFMASCIDLGDKQDIHPRDKVPVGQRLAALALKNVYGKKILTFPKLKSIQLMTNGTVEVSIEKFGQGFKPVNGFIPGFEVAGEDGEFTSVTARLMNGHTILLETQGKVVKQVRYAWMPFPEPQLVLYVWNGFPLGPFVEEVK